MKRPLFKTFLVLALGLSGAALLAQEPTEHPRLVSAETAQCGVCHEDLIGGKGHVHPPVADDCTTCHEFSVGDDGTTVALMDTEPALCVFCHDDKEAAVEMELATPHMPAADSCLTCHSAHASDHEHILLSPATELCAECHDVEDLDEVHGGQLTEATRCATCHNPHGSDNERMLLASKLHAPFEEGSCKGCHRQPFGDRIRLRARGEKLCTACHGEFEVPEGGSEHAALHGERGRAGCLSCHNPHMSDNNAVLLEAGNDVCQECHAEVVEAASADSGHYPAGEDCLNCHGPHVAEQQNLLIEARGEICATCHDLDAEGDLAAPHLGADPSHLDCLSCHSPHGTGNMKSLAENLHPPLEDGCDTCHEGAYDELMEGGGSELCLFCHEDPAEGHPVPHEALELASCTDCHNPHASAQEKLVKAPGAGPCADCHDEQVAAPDEVAHGVIDLVGCRACHEPHGGEKEKLLRVEGSELCLSCHGQHAPIPEPGAETVLLMDRFEVAVDATARLGVLSFPGGGASNHPVTGHRALGTPTPAEMRTVEVDFSGELTCMTCHDPHKGRTAKLFQWNAASSLQVCQNCHTK